MFCTSVHAYSRQAEQEVRERGPPGCGGQEIWHGLCLPSEQAQRNPTRCYRDAASLGKGKFEEIVGIIEMEIFFFPSYLLPVAEQPHPCCFPLRAHYFLPSSPISLAEEVTGLFFSRCQIPPYQTNPGRSKAVTFSGCRFDHSLDLLPGVHQQTTAWASRATSRAFT